MVGWGFRNERRRTVVAFCIACSAAVLSPPAIAQTSLTDAEEQRHKAQREAEDRQQRQQAPDVRLPRLRLTTEIEESGLPAESPCFQVDAKGNPIPQAK